MGEAGKERRGERLAGRLHLLRPRLQRRVRVVIGALAHDMRQHRPVAPRHGRAHLALHHAEERLAGAHPGLVIVDMRIGLIAGQDIGVGDDLGIEVGVHVERHGDRGFRRDLAQPREQSPLAILEMLGHHRAVKIEEDRIAALGDGAADRLG